MITELFLAAIVTVITAGIKRYAGTNGIKTIIVLIGVSFIGALVFQSLVYLGYWEHVLQLAVLASGIYALLTGAKPE